MTTRNLLIAVLLLAAGCAATNEELKYNNQYAQMKRAAAFYDFERNCDGYVFIKHSGRETGRERLLNLPGKGARYYCIEDR